MLHPRHLGGRPQQLDIGQRDDLSAAARPPLALGPSGPARPAAGAGVLLALEVGGGDPLLVGAPDGREPLVDHVGPARAVRGEFAPVQLGPGKDHEVFRRVSEAEDELGETSDEMGQIGGLFKPIDPMPSLRVARVPVHPVGLALVPAPSRPRARTAAPPPSTVA
ncbi:hypothetical protein AQJ66_14185 [Streptomyces bungoensis]|uniref:Uncharacterized protein n=1 Tax=Streptomyces bungoensis TaxID=285568 RepID=A0A101T3Y3_9ACTN|nr:hypothetical protein AQJ66_14185 [Streptomyces bungoensis]